MLNKVNIKMNNILEDLRQSVLIGKITIEPETSEQILNYIEEKDKEIKQLNECLKEIDLIIYRLRFVEFLDRDACIRSLDNILKDIRYISQTGDYKNYMKRGK